MAGKRTVLASTSWIVANPRAIPAGRYILHQRDGESERWWFEGDAYDGPVTERLVSGGFIVQGVSGG